MMLHKSTTIIAMKTIKTTIKLLKRNLLLIASVIFTFFISSLGVSQNLTGYQTNGSAINYGNGLIRMTAAGESWVVGSAWNTTQHSLKDTFELTVNLFFGCDAGPNGADGIAFQMHTDAGSINALGAGGGGMGMLTSNSLAVEFDTWNYAIGGDIADDHITIIQDGNPNSVGPGSAPYLAGPTPILGGRDLEDCAQNSNDYYTVTYRFIPGAVTQTLEVYEEHAAAPSLSYTGDIINDIFDGDTLVWWGFTASTGGGDNEQWVAPEGAIIPWQCTVNSCCAPFDVTTSGPVNICQGDTLDLSVLGTYEQYSWSTGDSTATTQITAPGWYTVDVIQNQSGSFCPGTDSIQVLNTGVTGTFTGDTTICDDGVTTTPLTITFSGGTGPYSLTYSIDNNIQPTVTGITSSPYTFNSATGSGLYEIESFEDATGCNGFISGTVEITLYPGTPSALDTTICSGTSTTLSVVDEGGTYDWFADASGGLSLLTGATFTTPILTSDTIMWVENTTIVDSVEIVSSYTDSLSGTGTANRTEGYNASFDVNTLYFTANRDMLLDSIDAYTRQYGGVCGDIDIQIRNITANTTETINYTPTCQGLGVNIYTIPMGYDLIEGNDYVIAFNSNGPHVPINFNNIVPSYPITDYSPITFTSSDLGTNSHPGLFRFQVSYPYEGASCLRTPVTATVLDNPMITKISDTVSCDGLILPQINGFNLTSNAAYFNTTNGTGLSYSPGDTITNTQPLFIYDSLSTAPYCADEDTFNITISISPSITVTGTDPLNCDALDGAILISGLDNNTDYHVSYNGNTSTILTSDGSGEISIDNLPEATYSNILVTSLDNCSDSVTSITLTDPSHPTLLIPEDTVICSGNGYILTAGNPDMATISWSNGETDGTEIFPTATTILIAEATLMNCVTTDSFTLGVQIPPTATISGGGIICENASSPTTIQFDISAGTTPYSLVYNDGNSDNVSLTLSSTPSTITTTTEGNYSLVSISDSNGCVGTATGDIDVETIPALIVSPLDEICSGDNTTYTVSFSMSGGEAPYSISGMGINETTSSSTFTSSAISTGSGSNQIYNFQITESSGCTSTSYTGSVDGEVSCINTTIAISNAMTPNGDGFNDTFWILNIEAYPDNELQIFNRWGDLIYEANGYANEWDGTRNGKVMPMGTYYYILNLNDGTDVFTGYLMVLE